MIKVNGIDKRIGLMMICGDEPKIKDAILSVKPYMDEILVGWNGNKPETEEIFKELGVSYFKQAWEEDFSKARNDVMNRMDADFLLWLDSDDTVDNAENIPEACVKGFSHDHVGALWADYLYDFDKDGNCVMRLRRERIVRRGCHRWVGKLHENLIQLMDVHQMETNAFQIRHHALPGEIQEKAARNLKIIENEYFREAETGTVDPRTVYDYARSLKACGLWQEALPVFREFLTATQSDDDRAIVLVSMSEICRKFGQLETALELASHCARIRPTWPDGYLEQGITYCAMERWKEAVVMLNFSSCLEPPMGNIPIDPIRYKSLPWRYLTLAYFSDMDIPNAERACFQALKYHPKNEFLLEIKKKIEEINRENKTTESVITMKLELEEAKDEERLKHLSLAIPEYMADHPVFVRLRNRYAGPKNNRIVIFCGDSAEMWSPLSVKTGIGGSEEAVIHMSRELSKLGWLVDIYCYCSSPGNYDGVQWKQYWEYVKEEPCDIFIAWRLAHYIEYAPKGSRNFLWLHDVQKPEYYTPKRIEMCEKIFFLSKYHRSTYAELPEEKVWYTRNGIVREHFDLTVPKQEKSCIYASSPDRGLETILDAWPDIRKEQKDATLHVFYGFTKNFDEIHKYNERMRSFKDKILNQLRELQPMGVKYHGRVGHMELADHFLRSEYFLYPCSFEEISCITAMKAQAAGAWPIYMDYCAVGETTQFGDKTSGNPNNKDVKEAWKKSVLNRMSKGVTPEEVAMMKSWALNNYGWNTVAKEWDGLFRV